MDKRTEKLKGGLNSLIPDRRGEEMGEEVTAEKSSDNSDKEAVEVTARKSSGNSSREALINTIEDEALREALQKRLNTSKLGRPRKDDATRRKQEETYTRYTFIFRRDQLAKIKGIALRETLLMKELIEAIFDKAISEYEAEHGEIRAWQKKSGRERARDLFKKK